MKKCCFLILAFTLLLTGCSTKQSENKAIEKGSWLASVNNDTIFSNYFISRFESTPHIGEGYDAGATYLKAMVLEKLLSINSSTCESNILLNYETFEKQLEDETLVETLLMRKVNKNITISDDELREHYERLITILKMDAVAFKDSSVAEAAFHFLSTSSKNNSFDDILKNTGNYFVYNKIVNQDLRYNESATEFEKAAYSLKENSFSRPLKTDNLWWILRLRSKGLANAPSENDFQSKVPYLSSVIKNRKLPSIQLAYINTVMKGKSVGINSDALDILADYLEYRLPEVKGDEEPPTIAKRNKEISSADLNEEDLNLSVMELEGFSKSNLSVRDVLNWFSVSPRTIPRQKSKNLLKRLIHRELLFIAEFNALADEARKLELHNDREVVIESDMWKDHIMAQAGMGKLLKRTGATRGMDSLEKTKQLEADSLMICVFDSLADANSVSFNWLNLKELELSSAPVFLRKTHFPNRPAAPVPVAYRWAILWEY